MTENRATGPMESSPNQAMNEADVFEAVVDAVPGSPAVTMDGVTLTYAEFDAAANRMAHLLLAHGVPTGGHVALYMRNSIEHLSALIGCMKARLVGINVNYRYTVDEIAYLFSDARAAAVLLDAEYAPVLTAVLDRLPELRVALVVGGVPEGFRGACTDAGVEVVDVDTEWPAQSAERDLPARSGDDRWVLYTGGTTGFPKGVEWRMADYYYACLSGGNPYGEPHHEPAAVGEQARGGAGFVIMLSAPLMHGAGTFTLLTFFNMGGHVVMQRDFDADAVAREVAERRATMLVFVGDGMGVPILDALRAHADEYDYSSVFAVSSGGGIWSRTNRDGFAALFPHAVLRDNFGASEAGNDGEIGMDERGELRLPPSPRVGLVDEDHRPIPPGSDEIGYIIRRGHIPLGYWGDEEKTARTFPVIDGERVSLLGEMGRIEADGTIVFLGRGSGCINTGGEKVFPEEVEQALKAHPAVFDAVVAGVPDPRFGQAVSAVVQYREGQRVTEDELRGFLSGTLARYKVPRHVVEVPQVRRSPAGKADYRWAREQLGAS